jgi:hypothetical protein
MSSLVSDEFVEAVKNNSSWDLLFPDYETEPEKYYEEWDGNLKAWVEKGYPVKVYRTIPNANELESTPKYIICKQIGINPNAQP